MPSAGYQPNPFLPQGPGRGDRELAGEAVGRAFSPAVPPAQRRVQRDGRPGRDRRGSLGPQERGEFSSGRMDGFVQVLEQAKGPFGVFFFLLS